MEGSQSMTSIVDRIDRIANPSRDRLEEYISNHRPVILSGLMETQAASRSWDLPYLRSRIGSQDVEFVRHSSPRLYWDPQAGLAVETARFAEFADRVLFANDGHYSYLQDDVNSFPCLKADYQLPAMMAAKPLVRTKFWLSGKGMITPLHYDPVETFHWVIRGGKRFSLFAPGLRRYYPFSWRSKAPFISQLDPDGPDQARFPRFREAVRVECQLAPGDVLYLPAFWWHQVYSDDSLNVSLNFVWFSSISKSLRHLPQFARCFRHIAWRLSQAKAKARSVQAADLGAPARPVA
jgi:[protein]-arginine 3-hydroxylase / protease